MYRKCQAREDYPRDRCTDTTAAVACSRARIRVSFKCWSTSTTPISVSVVLLWAKGKQQRKQVVIMPQIKLDLTPEADMCAPTPIDKQGGIYSWKTANCNLEWCVCCHGDGVDCCFHSIMEFCLRSVSQFTDVRPSPRLWHSGLSLTMVADPGNRLLLWLWDSLDSRNNSIASSTSSAFVCQSLRDYHKEKREKRCGVTWNAVGIRRCSPPTTPWWRLNVWPPVLHMDAWCE